MPVIMPTMGVLAFSIWSTLILGCVWAEQQSHNQYSHTYDHEGFHDNIQPIADGAILRKIATCSAHIHKDAILQSRDEFKVSTSEAVRILLDGLPFPIRTYSFEDNTLTSGLESLAGWFEFPCNLQYFTGDETIELSGNQIKNIKENVKLYLKDKIDRFSFDPIIKAKPVTDRLSSSNEEINEFTVTSVPTDPAWTEQWYLNVLTSKQYQDGKAALGSDIHALKAWDQGVSGQGQKVVVIDTGIQWNHPDLNANYDKSCSFNYDSSNKNWDTPSDPKPTGSTMNHGTGTTSLIAAGRDNGQCIAGVAYNAKWCGRFLIDASFSSAAEKFRHALSHGCEGVQTMSNSWGFVACDEGYCEYLEPGDYFEDPINTCSAVGNNGLGTVYVFASGNDGDLNLNTNAGMECRNPNVICVGAITSDGVVANYTTYGPNLFITAPSGGSTQWGNVPIRTCQNQNLCKDYGAGTSFSCPLVSGVTLLMREANPSLNARDVQEILRITANSTITCLREDKCKESSWITNGAGIRHNAFYGFGKVNAEAAVSLAKTWDNAIPQFSELQYEIFSDPNGVPISQIDTSGYQYEGWGWEYTVHVDSKFIELANVWVAAEWVGKVDTEHGFTKHPSEGKLRIKVTSPSGTQSSYLTNLAKTYDWSTENGNEQLGYLYPIWLRSLQFWGEDPYGDWKIVVLYDNISSVGTKQYLYSLNLKISGMPLPFYSESINKLETGSPLVLYENNEFEFEWTYNNAYPGLTGEETIGFSMKSIDHVWVTMGTAGLSSGVATVVVPEGWTNGYIGTEIMCMHLGPVTECDKKINIGKTLNIRVDAEKIADNDILIISPKKGIEIEMNEPFTIQWAQGSLINGKVYVTAIRTETEPAGGTIPEGTEIIIFEGDASAKRAVYSFGLGTQGFQTICIKQDNPAGGSQIVKSSVTVRVVPGDVKINVRTPTLSAKIYDYFQVDYVSTSVVSSVDAYLREGTSQKQKLLEANLPPSGSFKFIPQTNDLGLYRVVIFSPEYYVEGVTNPITIEYQDPLRLQSDVPEKSWKDSTICFDLRTTAAAGNLFKIYARPSDGNGDQYLKEEEGTHICIAAKEVSYSDCYFLAKSSANEQYFVQTSVIVISSLSQIAFVLIIVFTCITVLALAVAIFFLVRYRKRRAGSKRIPSSDGAAEIEVAETAYLPTDRRQLSDTSSATSDRAIPYPLS